MSLTTILPSDKEALEEVKWSGDAFTDDDDLPDEKRDTSSLPSASKGVAQSGKTKASGGGINVRSSRHLSS